MHTALSLPRDRVRAELQTRVDVKGIGTMDTYFLNVHIEDAMPEVGYR